MLEAIIALVTTTALLLGSPGPATLSLAGVGAAAGFRGGLPYLGGILLGLAIVTAASAAGAAALLAARPGLRFVLQIAAAMWIFFIAWRIAKGTPADENSLNSVTPGFRDGLVLNLLNPKAYASIFALLSQFLLPFGSQALATFATGALVFLTGLVVDVAWLAIGRSLAAAFGTPRAARLLRLSFAVMIVTITLWVLLLPAAG